MNAPVKATRMRFQQLMKLAFVLRCSEKSPIVDNVDVGTLADANGTAMGPHRDSQWPESPENTHQLFLSVYPPYTAAAFSIYRARRAAGSREPRYAEQAMAQAVLCREANERIPRFALGSEDAERVR